VSARIALLGYAAALLLGTSVHHPGLLAVALAAVLVMAGRKWARVLRKASLAVLAFNTIVTVSYAVMAGLEGTFSLHYVVLVNLRVLFLTCLTFLFVARVNLFEALAFSRSLTYLFTLACGQAMTLTRVLVNFRLALKSRSIDQPVLGDRYRQVASAGVLLLDKSLHDATEITHAMRSRGVFDD
jgi:cobalt/nickel transport system permease protein